MEEASLRRRQGSCRKLCSAGGEVHGGSLAPPGVGRSDGLLEMTHPDMGYTRYPHCYLCLRCRLFSCDSFVMDLFFLFSPRAS